jgi:hypothetical protein
MALVLPVKLGPDGEYGTSDATPHNNQWFEVDLESEIDSQPQQNGSGVGKSDRLQEPGGVPKLDSQDRDKWNEVTESDLLTSPHELMRHGCCTESLSHRLRFAVCFSSTLLAVTSTIMTLAEVISSGIKPAELGASVVITLGVGVICIALSISGCLGAALGRLGAFWAFLILVTTLQGAQLAAVLTVFLDSDFGTSLGDSGNGVEQVFVYVALGCSTLVVVPNLIAALILLVVGCSRPERSLCGRAWCDGVSRVCQLCVCVDACEF